MKTFTPSRRRFIGIFAASAGLGMTPWMVRKASAMTLEPVVWRGIALGADAELHIYHVSAQKARQLIELAVAEVRRLEKIFSLYQEDSVLSRLNREGFIDNPPADFIRLLSDSKYFSTLTSGAFDPSVQSLWKLYAEHFIRNPGITSEPDAAEVRRVLGLVNHRQIYIEDQRVGFLVPGMALTLNGIAQGYITDRVTQLLRQAGLERSLVDMGEIRGLDVTDSGPDWKAGIRNPEQAGQILATIPLKNEALSTSGGYGTMFDEAGKFTHLFNPVTGACQPAYRSVSVRAPNATTADALSTAFSVMSLDNIKTVMNKLPGVGAWLLMPDGTLNRLGQTA
ncbi:MAG: FAD:protein FMN transferase [Advenella sp.]